MKQYSYVVFFFVCFCDDFIDTGIFAISFLCLYHYYPFFISCRVDVHWWNYSYLPISVGIVITIVIILFFYIIIIVVVVDGDDFGAGFDGVVTDPFSSSQTNFLSIVVYVSCSTQTRLYVYPFATFPHNVLKKIGISTYERRYSCNFQCHIQTRSLSKNWCFTWLLVQSIFKKLMIYKTPLML